MLYLIFFASGSGDIEMGLEGWEPRAKPEIWDRGGRVIGCEEEPPLFEAFLFGGIDPAEFGSLAAATFCLCSGLVKWSSKLRTVVSGPAKKSILQ